MLPSLSGNLGFQFKSIKTDSELAYLAYMDPLTNCYNRNMLEEMREHLDKMDLFVAIADVDNLKYINDKWGHFAGDDLLTNLSFSLRASNDAVYRLGGDEFLVLNKKSIDIVTKAKVSCGTTYKSTNTSLRDAMYEADWLMRENKAWRKNGSTVDIPNVEPLIFKDYATALAIVDDMNFLIKLHGYATINDYYHFIEFIIEQPPFELDSLTRGYKIMFPTPKYLGPIICKEEF